MVSSESVSTKTTLAVMTAAGIHYHAAANSRAGTWPGRAGNSFQIARNSF